MINIDIKSKKRLFSKLQGKHLSKYGGSGVEFLELREYSIYDNARHINFKRSNPYQNPLVNIYGDERELNVVVVYLISASLEYKSKKDIAKDVASTLCYIGSNERLNLLLFSNKVEKFFQNIKRNEAFDLAYDTISSIEHFQKSIDYTNLSNFLSKSIKEKSIIFLVGDFLEPNIKLDELLFMHEVYLLIIRDKSEENLDISSSNLLNPFNKKIRFFNINNSTKQKYKKEFELQEKNFLNYLIKNGVDYKKIYSKDEVISKIKSFWESF